MQNRGIIGSVVASLVILSGCTFTSSVTPNQEKDQQQTSGATNPIIQAIAPNPTAVASKDSVMTFTATVHSPDGSALDYTWSSTKGYLSATKGQMVSWTPQKADGSLEIGIATIQVLVTNAKGGSSQASVNIQIAQDGSASKQ